MDDHTVGETTVGGSTVAEAPDENEQNAENANEDHVYGSFFAKGDAINWTTSDLARLLSIDELHTRLLEYHNNVHARTIYGTDTGVSMNGLGAWLGKDSKDNRGNSAKINLPHFNEKDIVVQIKLFSESSAKESPVFMTYNKLSNWLIEYSDSRRVQQAKLVWIHIKDPAVLPELAEKFNIHELCMSAFSDLRAFSSFIPVTGAVFMSFCTFMLERTKANMFKVFIYVTKEVVVTFEREIMPDMLEEHGPVQDQVCSSIMARHEKIHRGCCNLGGIYLMYRLSLQSLAVQDSIIDFFSRTLYFFKQNVSTRQYHKDKLKIARQMHAVSVAVTMVKNSIMHAEDTFVRLLSGAMTGIFTVEDSASSSSSKPTEGVIKLAGAGDASGKAGAVAAGGAGADAESSKSNRAGGGVSVVQINGVEAKVATSARIPLLAPTALLSPDDTPYLLDLVDSYKFVNHLLNTELEEVQALTSAMDALTTLRSINTSTLLSLVATVFLPLNFVCGIFGTNFVSATTGEYFMTILNNPWGPTYFLLICLVSVFVIVMYFWYNGWVDMRIKFSRLCHALTCQLFASHQPRSKVSMASISVPPPMTKNGRIDSN